MTDARATIEADQLARLNALLRELRGGNRFYQPRLERAGITGDVDSLATFTAVMPFTFKHELVDDQQQHPPYGANLTYPLDRYVRYHQTSGTTGVPMRWLDTAESWEWMLGNWGHVLRAAGVTASDRAFFAFSFGPFLGFWTGFESAQQVGCMCIPGGGMSTAARLQLMRDNDVTVLCCTPTYAIHLAEVAEQEGIDLAAMKVRVIIAAGEPGASVPATRRHIADRWGGARVFDHHGMTEIGPVTYEHPRRPGTLRVIESSYLAEVIEPATGQPVGPGVIGELVLTTLGRAGSPILRYRTGDLVRVVYVDETTGEPGSGPHLALDGGILARADDMILVRGVNVFPSAVDQIVRGCEGVAEYRVTVDTSGSMTELSIEVEPTNGESHADLGHRVAHAIRDALSLRVPVTVVDTLPRFELKAKRWIRT
ncbi:MAG: AMP-binding protein [Phycisphaera sp.]|nr:AMP-binding protein [Phycisphaera sp.]